MSSPENHPQDTADSKQAVDNSRREAMKKIGKYSAYTAPALLALLTPKQGRAAVLSVVSPPV